MLCFGEATTGGGGIRQCSEFTDDMEPLLGFIFIDVMCSKVSLLPIMFQDI